MILKAVVSLQYQFERKEKITSEDLRGMSDLLAINNIKISPELFFHQEVEIKKGGGITSYHSEFLSEIHFYIKANEEGEFFGCELIHEFFKQKINPF